MAAKRSSEQYQHSLQQTQALRQYVPTDMRPLFDHCIVLAKDSHKSGYAKRAGRELLHARKLARPPEDYAPPVAPKRAKGVRVSPVERSVLAIARVDYEDDRDGAEFFEAKERTAARKLAERGFLRVLSDDRKVVRAVLTSKGAELLEQLRGGPGDLVVRLVRRERGNQADVMVNGRSAAHGAYDMGGGDLVRAFRGVVGELREKHPGAHIVLPGGLMNEHSLIDSSVFPTLLEGPRK